MDVAAWLRGLGLEQYAGLFRDNDIDGEILCGLAAEDLKELGISSFGHRRRLLDAIAALGAAVPVASLTAAPRDAPTPADAERRQLTVMFCDLVGSTALSARLDPEDLREIIAAYHRAVAEIVTGFDGFVAKYMGDGVLVYFGYPRAHEDDAERAVRAGLGSLDAVGRLDVKSTKLQARVGIATGLVVVGDLIGEGSAQEQAVVGETPNLAARLQTLATPVSLVIAASTRQQIGELFDLEDLGLQQLAGFAEPQRAWRVLGESAEVSRFEALRSGTTPLVGRDEEVELLSRRWQQTKTSEGRVVLISGEPGIGKSRLTAALSEQIGSEPHTRLRYFCSPHHQDSALYPFIAQLERAAGFARDDAAEARLAKLRALLATGTRDDGDFALLSELLSLPSSAADLNLSPQRKREKLFEALLNQLEAEAQHRPVLMVFEDAHWIDPTSRELLDLTVDRVRHLPVLMAITFRPEFQPPWGGRSHVTSLTLNRLGERDGEALVQSLIGNAVLAPDIVAEIVERTDGVPLFVEELTKAVLESAERGDRVAAVLATTSLAALSVPATLHASLMARLDRLGPAPKEIAQIGAVLGRGFAYELIELVAQRHEKELQAGLDQLSDAGLLFCRGTAPHASYLFKHALVQDAAYSTLLRGRRQELHARVAGALEEHFPDLVERQPELLAQHLTAAGDAEGAVPQWLKAGQRANARFAVNEAAAHLAKGLGILEEMRASRERDEREIEFQLALAIPLIAMHGFGSEQVEVCAKRVQQLAEGVGQHRNGFTIHRFVWNSCLLRRPVPESVALAQRLMALARESGDPAQLAIAHRALAYSMNVAGALEDADKLFAEGIDLADGLSDGQFAAYGEHPGMVCRVYRAQTRCLMGFPDDCVRLAKAGIEHARKRKNPFSLAWSLAATTFTYILVRDASAVERVAQEAIAVSQEHRLPQWLAFAQNGLGRAMCWQGNPRRGIEFQEEGMQSLHATGSVFQTTRLRVQLAESFLELAELDQAGSHLNAAFTHLQTHGEMYVAPELYRVRTMLLQAKGAPAEVVEAPIWAGLDTARSQGCRFYELLLATSLARLWAEQGRRAEARELLAPVYGIFTEGFDTAVLKEAKALLDELT